MLSSARSIQQCFSAYIHFCMFRVQNQFANFFSNSTATRFSCRYNTFSQSLFQFWKQLFYDTRFAGPIWTFNGYKNSLQLQKPLNLLSYLSLYCISTIQSNRFPASLKKDQFPIDHLFQPHACFAPDKRSIVQWFLLCIFLLLALKVFQEDKERYF